MLELMGQGTARQMEEMVLMNADSCNTQEEMVRKKLFFVWCKCCCSLFNTQKDTRRLMFINDVFQTKPQS